MFNILSLIVKEKIVRKFLFFKFKYYRKSIISLDYNIDEDRIYYTDKRKEIPTKKDLCRSICIIYDIFNRYKKFNINNDFIIKIKNDNIKEYLKKMRTIKDANEFEKIIFGSNPFSCEEIDMRCSIIGIFDKFEMFLNIPYRSLDVNGLLIDTDEII